METSFILHKEESRTEKPYNVLGMPTYLKVAGKDTNNQLSGFYGDYRRNQGPPLNLHDMDEAFYIIEGEFLFQLGDKKVKAVAGSTVFVPGMMPHAWLVTSEIGRMIFTLTPTGNIETLFEKYDSYETFPTVDELIRISEELGFPILGPQITED